MSFSTLPRVDELEGYSDSGRRQYKYSFSTLPRVDELEVDPDDNATIVDIFQHSSASR